MALLVNISKFLSHNKIQRLCYAIAAGLWLLIFSDTFRHFDAVSSIGITYRWLTLIPICLLTAQVVLNNKVIWLIIVGLIIGFTLYALCATVSGIIEQSADHLKPLTIGITDVFVVLIYFALLAAVNWTIIQLRPKRRQYDTNAKHQL